MRKATRSKLQKYKCPIRWQGRGTAHFKFLLPSCDQLYFYIPNINLSQGYQVGFVVELEFEAMFPGLTLNIYFLLKMKTYLIIIADIILQLTNIHPICH